MAKKTREERRAAYAAQIAEKANKEAESPVVKEEEAVPVVEEKPAQEPTEVADLGGELKAEDKTPDAAQRKLETERKIAEAKKANADAGHGQTWYPLKKMLDQYVMICKTPAKDVKELKGRMLLANNIATHVINYPILENVQLVSDVVTANRRNAFLESNIFVMQNELSLDQQKRFGALFTYLMAIADLRLTGKPVKLSLEAARVYLGSDTLINSFSAIIRKYA